MDRDVVSEGFNKALALLESVNDNVDSLPGSVASYIMVYSAQSILDVGGYYYFFESNFPNEQPYSRFVEAYSAIGCERQAADLARVVATFSFENPHLDAEMRNNFMDINFDEKTDEVKGWGDALFCNDEVWKKLEEFYLRHKVDFS